MPEITQKQRVIQEITMMLGGGKVRVELTPEQFNLAIKLAVETYRQRAENAVEESHMFLELQDGISEYTLPEEVIEVRQIFQRGISGTQTGGTEFEPFALAYTNAYLLQATRTGDLLTYELYHQFLETAGRLFGAHINFVWDVRTRKLKLIRHPRGSKDVVLWVYNKVPDELLLQDPYAGPWLRSWAHAEAMLMLAEVRGKFSAGLPGPQGAISLNGDVLRGEAKELKEKLELAIKNYEDGSMPLPFLIG